MESPLELSHSNGIAHQPGAALEHPMSAPLLSLCLSAYAAAGIATGLGFVAFGAAQVLPGASFSGGARALIFPGAAVLWPYVLYRWLRHGASKTRVLAGRP